MDKAKSVKLRHRGRLYQIPIYLGKQLRSFIYMNDWKILPMTAVIAALVSMVVRHSFFTTMEGTLTGSFALTCVAIWNGTFNSIQVICRERATVKREHRSGMHISSYICSHMIYQALLCLMQTVITLYICLASGVKFPSDGFITHWFMVDISVTIFLITYASDMVSLFFSALAHSTTAAMTVMPFILIFQLVFSGSIFTLPSWATKISKFTISNYGLKCIAAQADYNSREMTSGWNTLSKVADKQITGEIPAGTLMDILEDDKGLLADYRKTPLSTVVNGANVDVGLGEEGKTMTVGEALDTILALPAVTALRDTMIPYSFTAGQLMDLYGRDKVREYIVRSTSDAMYNEAYAHSEDNIVECWFFLACFAAIFAVGSVIILEFIDHDKR